MRLEPGFRVRNRNRFPVGLGVAEIAEFEFLKSVMHGRLSGCDGIDACT